MQLCLMDARTCRAWELRDRIGKITRWSRSDVDYQSLEGEECTDNAYRMYAPYRLDIGSFIDGRTYVTWMLYPDGQYFADGEGYGAKDNDEMTVYAVMDSECRLSHPFSLMSLHEAMKLAYGDKMPKPKPIPRPAVQLEPEVRPDPVPSVQPKPGLWKRMVDALVEILMA